MAAGNEASVFSSHDYCDNPWLISNRCISCIDLERELADTRLELKSAWEIIKILQETRVTYADAVARPNPEGSNVGPTWRQNKRCVSLKQLNEIPRSLPISTFNRFEILDESDEYNEERSKNNGSREERNKKNDSKEARRKKNESRTLVEVKSVSESVSVRPNMQLKTLKPHKVSVIGDSHARGCASGLSVNLRNTDYDVYGIVKPGVGLEEITRSAKEDLKCFTKQDVIVVWGGTNDVGRNNTDKSQRHLQSFVENNKQTNIIIITAPHRYDLT